VLIQRNRNQISNGRISLSLNVLIQQREALPDCYATQVGSLCDIATRKSTIAEVDKAAEPYRTMTGGVVVEMIYPSLPSYNEQAASMANAVRWNTFYWNTRRYRRDITGDHDRDNDSDQADHNDACEKAGWICQVHRILKCVTVDMLRHGLLRCAL